jgi:hypothetical protein
MHLRLRDSDAWGVLASAGCKSAHVRPRRETEKANAVHYADDAELHAQVGGRLWLTDAPEMGVGVPVAASPRRLG